MSVSPPFSVERIVLQGPMGQTFRPIGPVFCRTNPTDCCTESGGSGSSAPVVGNSGAAYNLVNEYQAFELPAGTKILDRYCTKNPVCCGAAGASQGSVSGCGTILLPDNICPEGLPECIAVTIVGAGDCACLSGTYICQHNLGSPWPNGFWTCANIPQSCNPPAGNFNIFLNFDLAGNCNVVLTQSTNPLVDDLATATINPFVCCPLSGSAPLTMTSLGGVLCTAGGTVSIASGQCATSDTTNSFDGLTLTNEYAVVQLPPGWQVLATGCEDRPDCTQLCLNLTVEVPCCGTATFPQGLFVLIQAPSIPLIDGQSIQVNYELDVFGTGFPGWVSPVIPVPVPGNPALSMLVVVGCPDLISTWEDCPDASGLQVLVAVGDPSGWGAGPANPSCFYLCCSVSCPPQNEEFVVDSCTANPVLGPNVGTSSCPDTVNGPVTLWLLS